MNFPNTTAALEIIDKHDDLPRISREVVVQMPSATVSDVGSGTTDWAEDAAVDAADTTKLLEEWHEKYDKFVG